MGTTLEERTMNYMLVCLIASSSIVVSDTGVRDRVCEYKCQKELKETVYTMPYYQCPKRLYIDDPERNPND